MQTDINNTANQERKTRTKTERNEEIQARCTKYLQKQRHDKEINTGAYTKNPTQRT